MSRPTPNYRVIAALCIVAGSIPIGIGLGFIPAKPESMHAPRYVIALTGLSFWLAAAAFLAGATRPRLNHLFGGILLALFAVVLGWVSIFGADGGFGGGIPFVSHATNASIARALFGGGSVLCAAFSVYVLGKAVRGRGHMPLRSLIPIFAATTLVGIFSVRVHAAEESAAIAPTLTIEEALDAAKRCVLDRNVHLVGSFIESARFERNARGDRGPYWVITWAYAREVKGGQLFVSVFQSRTCELRYGE